MADHTTRLKLIEILSDGEFHSGEKIGEVVGISRAAIGKHIRILESWGIELERVQGKGYRVTQPITLLDGEIIARLAPQCPQLTLSPVIDSTNQYMLDNIAESKKGAVCLAEYQQSGRGRRGRQWLSPFGSNLYMSMYWRLDQGIAAAMGLSLVVGIAVTEAIRQLGAKDVMVKWPNDIYHQDKKLAGILVELRGQTGDAAHLVIGLGLNVSMPDTDQQSIITQPWSNLVDACDTQIDRNQLAAHIITHLTDYLQRYEREGLAGFTEQWNQLDNFKGREVKIVMGHQEVFGIAQGINESGALLLETDDGVKSFIGGEISLRGC
ncbi:bifunctional biotin--[acetyl-CoA-carboxylase] ligase/biotin operon repressor BirA [Vibrio sp. SS-MA-C1-2]|uniref:bifunctional biotin--[acetyl-CoA-carboxylase] ligase/biotin operon repressor BirA n=1 Tax=Vibrio sp. SS-MA-C1-2 TaxID=2908646 RepID=UPI001F2EF118|nr:bifunctional biotin--[acetyl-CoA-carboxylase] ligase/biotin operon repressor BirA [Vibrio sp. SS-MA-C1-2]UJF19192.1 bifunctional biotin--[acetyl-CoA-carboxylase] ligase/biotin operon repressor BirA [Vibrio sp. SS-MA-C1-2]